MGYLFTVRAYGENFSSLRAGSSAFSKSWHTLKGTVRNPLLGIIKMGYRTVYECCLHTCLYSFRYHNVAEATAKFGNVQKTPSPQTCCDAELCEWSRALRLLIFPAERLKGCTVSQGRCPWAQTIAPALYQTSSNKLLVWGEISCLNVSF